MRTFGTILFESAYTLIKEKHQVGVTCGFEGGGESRFYFMLYAALGNQKTRIGNKKRNSFFFMFDYTDDRTGLLYSLMVRSNSSIVPGTEASHFDHDTIGGITRRKRSDSFFELEQCKSHYLPYGSHER